MKTRETLSNLAFFFFFSFSAPRRARDNNTILFSTICDKTSGHSKLGRDEKRSTTIIIIILSSVVTHRNFIDCRRFSFFFILNVDHCCTHNSIYYIQSRFIVPPKSRPIYSLSCSKIRPTTSSRTLLQLLLLRCDTAYAQNYRVRRARAVVARYVSVFSPNAHRRRSCSCCRESNETTVYSARDR